MKTVLKTTIAAGALMAAVSFAPSSAVAAEQCLFQSVKVTDKNRTDVERSLLCLTNLHRFRNDRPLVFRDNRLAGAARAHSTDMATRNFFSHTNPEGLDPSARATAAGYPGGAGENIATDASGTVRSLFEQWRNSTTGHNENMLNASYKAAGFGVDPHCCPSGFPGITGTQMFGFSAANTKDDALDLYASSNRCAKAKLNVIAKRRAYRKAKKKGAAGAKERLKAELKTAKRTARHACAPLTRKDD